MQVRLLGSLEVVGPTGAVALGGRRQQAVLAVLLLTPNQAVSIDRLVDDVWGGEPPATAVATLQRYVSHLRRALDGLGVEIETRRPGYAVRIEPEAIDAHSFEALVAEGVELVGTGDPAAGWQRLREALDLWRGRPLADLADEPFAEAEVARLENLRMVALEHRVEADLALGRHSELVPELEHLVAEHPLREAFRGQLMRALHASGRRAEALRSFREAKEVLGEELGIDPSTELRRLEEAILLQDPAVEGPSARVAGGNLPAELTTFVGRTAEVGHVAELLARSRLVTLTGPGGTGKTRLALRAAGSVAATRSGGVWLVDLAPLTEPEAVARATARVLGVREEPDRPLLASLIDSLRRRDCLVVLDNCEHLLDAVAGLTDALLRECPRLQLLATSREALDVQAELAWAVPTLPVPDRAVTASEALTYDAVALLVERAAAAFPNFALDDGNVGTVVDVCRRLDGIPLAIELAAARLRVLSLAQLAERLSDRFGLLTAGGRTTLPRQRTLRAAVEWSYDLLSPEERMAFDRLAVFAGTFTLEAAEAILADEALPRPAVLDLLASLVSKSLVVRVDAGEGRARYRLLETLRAFAAEQLAAREAVPETRRRHVAFFTEMAETVVPQLQTPAAGEALEVMQAARADVAAALAWCGEHGAVMEAQRLAAAVWLFWDYRYEASAGRSWLERVLAGAETASPWALPAVVGLARLAWLDDDLTAARTWSEQGLTLAGEAGDDGARGRLLVIAGEVARHADDPAAASAMARQAVALLASVGDPWWEADATRLLTLLAWDRGDLDAAEALAHRCLDLWEHCGDVERVAGARCMLAGLARDRGDLGGARTLYEASLAGFRTAGEPAGAALVVRSLGTIAGLSGDHARALALGEESLRLHEDLGHRRGIGESYKVMGDACLNLGDLERAATLCEDALHRFRDRGFTGDIVPALQSLARVALARDDVDAAAELCEEALVPYRSAGLKRDAAPALCLLGMIRARQGRADEAVALCEESLSLFEELGDRRGMARSLEALATAAGDTADELGEAALARVVAQWAAELEGDPQASVQHP